MSNDTSNIPVMVASQTHQPEPINVSGSKPYVKPDVTECLIKGGVPGDIAPVIAINAHNDCNKGLQTWLEHQSSNGKGFVVESANWWPHGSLEIQGGGKFKKRTRKYKSRKKKERSRKKKERSKKRKKVKKTKFLRKKTKKSRKNKNIK